MKRILTWLAALALCLMLPYGVQAQESPRPPLEDGAIGQLRVDLVFGSDAKAEPLPDVPLALLRVASLESDRGAAVYTTIHWINVNDADGGQSVVLLTLWNYI